MIMFFIVLICFCAQLTAADQMSDKELIPYPLDTCIVTGQDLYAVHGPITFAYENREIKLCTKSCVMIFEDDPELYLAALPELPELPESASQNEVIMESSSLGIEEISDEEGSASTVLLVIGGLGVLVIILWIFWRP